MLLRQSMWVALFVTTCAWLQIPRLLNWLIAFLLALSLVAIEVFLRLRERPSTNHEPQPEPATYHRSTRLI
ncbi:MAG: hypothetical protein M5R40_23515 [Anaerolineae bacterium]|nr:hypothetical protein [Anaerolineae bacterium]